MSKWFFAVDRGGTFTDVIGIDSSNKIHTSKVLSESTLYDDSVIAGIRQILDLSPGEKIPLELHHIGHTRKTFLYFLQFVVFYICSFMKVIE